MTVPNTEALRCLVVLLLSTGIRWGEAVQIALDDIDFGNRELLVHGKGAKERVVPLGGQAIAAIRRWLKQRGNAESSLLLAGKSGAAIAKRTVNKMVARLVR